MLKKHINTVCYYAPHADYVFIVIFQELQITISV